MTRPDVYKQIKIHPRYIAAMEDNDYGIFDGMIHARGFVKIYAEMLELNVEQILALWRREHGYKFEDGLHPERNKNKTPEIRGQRLSFTPWNILAFLGFLILVAFFGYIFHSYKNYQGPPRLDIYYPEDNMVVERSLVDVTGKTDIDSTVLVNGETLLLKADGTFATSVHLKEGVNTLSIVSINKLERKKEEILTLIYRPEEVTSEVEDLIEQHNGQEDSESDEEDDASEPTDSDNNEEISESLE